MRREWVLVLVRKWEEKEMRQQKGGRWILVMEDGAGILVLQVACLAFVGVEENKIKQK